MRSTCLVLVALTACSSKVPLAVLDQPLGNPQSVMCSDEIGGARHTRLSDRRWNTKTLCRIPGPDNRTAGWGVIVVARDLAGSPSVACGFHILPTAIRGPVSFEPLLEKVANPILRFELRGLIGTIDPRRAFHRVANFPGARVDLEQFEVTNRIAGSGWPPNAPYGTYIEAEIDACTPERDDSEHANVATDGNVLF